MVQLLENSWQIKLRNVYKASLTYKFIKNQILHPAKKVTDNLATRKYHPIEVLCILVRGLPHKEFSLTVIFISPYYSN